MDDGAQLWIMGTPMDDGRMSRHFKNLRIDETLTRTTEMSNVQSVLAMDKKRFGSWVDNYK